MKQINDILGVYRRNWKLFVAVNVFYFGVVLFGAFLALMDPSAQMALINATSSGFGEGPLAAVSDAYTSGNIIQAAVLTFLVNLFAGTLLMITIPSLIFPPWAAMFGALRALLWGMMLVVPIEGVLPIKTLVPHYLTMLLEGEAYVIAIFGGLLPLAALADPKKFNSEKRLNAYFKAMLYGLGLLLAVAAMLAIAALYEAWEVPFFAGIL